MAIGVEREPGGWPADRSAKALGAYYTDSRVAGFLVRWAVRSAADTVLDPSFGGGVFLQAACERLVSLGGQPARQVFGVEIDPEVHLRTSSVLSRAYGLPESNLLLRDFFDVDAIDPVRVDVVVGNPPFIRYHRFNGSQRRRALARAADEGVRLSELASSWAPFLVHSIALLRSGGRLAMVVPMEIVHASYAVPVLRQLHRSFGNVTFLTFRKRLFPDLSEDVLLLLAEDRGASAGTFAHRDLDDAVALAATQDRGASFVGDVSSLDASAIAQGRQRLIEHLIPDRARQLYHELRALPTVRPLGGLADVGIGYVTGDNDFFHLGPNSVRYWGIPASALKPAVRRSRALRGLRFTASDWQEALVSGDASYLLHIEGDDLPDGLLRYLRHGEVRGVPRAYKCRTRSPWYRVPHVYRPDAFLSYMSGVRPSLVANDAGAFAPNSLHIVRMLPLEGLSGDGLAALWQTSLTSLSVEIEGHALGGGMLKLEPAEAGNVAIANPPLAGSDLIELITELDSLLRAGSRAEAQARADQVVLRQHLGLSDDDCRLLRDAADGLRRRRYVRGRST